MDRSIKLCEKKNSEFYLYFISLIESIFFPIPTDVFLFPYILAKKKNYIKIAISITIFSVLGGIIAYFLGYFLWNIISPTLSEYYPGFIFKLNNFTNQYLEVGNYFDYNWRVFSISLQNNLSWFWNNWNQYLYFYFFLFCFKIL